MTSIDLSQLPAPDVVETLDYETLLAERKAALIALYPSDEQATITATLALESEPIVKILQENAYREIVLRQRINEAAQAVLLASARGSNLDQIAANFGVKRFTLQEADTEAIPPVSAIMEEDEDLRARAQLAFEGLSVAGPSGAYISHAISADARVSDVTALSPAPCEALITVLAREGDGSATQDLLDVVASALGDEDVRPVGDRVTVQSAKIVPFTVEATIYPVAGPESEPIRAASLASLQKLISKKRRLGQSIWRTALTSALHVEGVQRVDLIKPAADIVLSKEQAGYCASVTLTKGDSGV